LAYIAWFIFAVSAALFVYLAIPRRRALESQSPPSEPVGALRGSTTAPSTRPSQASQRASEKSKVTLRERLVHAGLYSDHLLPVLRVMRFVLLGLFVFVGIQFSVFGVVSVPWGVFIGVLGGVSATIAPGFFLDHLKRRRQVAMRRALPDALDIIVVALEGGLPVAASFQRVSSELSNVHPLLAAELTIVQREVQMGRTLGQAISSMAARFDLDDLRNMASVIQQSEKYGASVTRAFRVFADGLRERRKQRAENLARQATVKMVFPTVIFIFPAMFVVILAPTVLRLVEFFRSTNANFSQP
jgi:tight adherence protein C